MTTTTQSFHSVSSSGVECAGHPSTGDSQPVRTNEGNIRTTVVVDPDAGSGTFPGIILKPSSLHCLSTSLLFLRWWPILSKQLDGNGNDVKETRRLHMPPSNNGSQRRENAKIDLWISVSTEIDNKTYKEQDSRLKGDIEAAELELRQVESQFLDLEEVLAFAEKIVTSPARLWLESSIDQRQRLQQIFFPQGVTYDGTQFRTPASSSFFDILRGFSEPQSHLASPTGFEPVLSP
jgi:hypothetical protein